MKTKGKKSLKSEAGIAISFEMLLVVAVIGVLLYIVASNIFLSKGKIAVAQASTALTEITSETQTLFKRQGTFAGISPAVLINNKIIPQDMVSGTNILNQWNQTVAVAPATVITANDAFTLTYPGVDKEACSALIQSSEASFYQIAVNGVLVKNSVASEILNPITLGAQCSAGAGSTALIVFSAGRN